MQEFTGFPAGSVASTPLPNIFFSKLAPLVDDLAELKVVLHVFWRLHQKKVSPRYITSRELRNDSVLQQSLKAQGEEPAEALGRALKLCVDHHTLLHVVAEIGGQEEQIYLLNDGHGRKALERLHRGELDLGQSTVVLTPTAEAKTERPGIFEVYEQNFGLLTPLIVDELIEAESIYPTDWILDAFKLAVEYNRRNWRYVRRILERWAVEGRRDEKGSRRAQGTGHTGPSVRGSI